MLAPRNITWDTAGVAASGICAVHCLAMPVVLAFAPSLGASFSHDGIFHPILAAAAVLIAAFAFRRSYLRHRNYRVLALAVAGAGILVFSAFNPGHLLNEVNERIITLLGGSLISASHVWNWRLNDSPSCCDATSHSNDSDSS